TKARVSRKESLKKAAEALGAAGDEAKEKKSAKKLMAKESAPVPGASVAEAEKHANPVTAVRKTPQVLGAAKELDVLRTAKDAEDARAAEVHAAKFELTPAAVAASSPAPAQAALAEFNDELPDVYLETRLVALVRDPETLFIYWDLSRADRERWHLAADDSKLILRVRDTTAAEWAGEGSGDFFTDTPVRLGDGRCYVRLPHTGRRWVARLGLLGDGGIFASICESNPVQTPRDSVAEEFAVGPDDEPAEEGGAGGTAVESSDYPPSGADAFENVFRLSGGYRESGSAADLSAAGESDCADETIQEPGVLRVRSVGSSEFAGELSEGRLKVKKIGASEQGR
ncbi:DUF4912 domain-containing protein, partial [Candidatus Sumerlaeota bacterium]|nr:DUF4912 domain-containing protein [Candidatus Sumerlaeota bacterium]